MKQISVILVGQPNVGKSSLINALCKSSLKVGNFSGVTIEKASAKINFKNYEIEFVDLPGTYALDGYSQEEMITQNYIKNEKYDLIINVLDSTNLRRNLILSTQLIDTNKKMIMVLNMSDEAKEEGLSIDAKKLSEISSRPCLELSAKTGLNLGFLLDLIIKTHENNTPRKPRVYGAKLENELKNIANFLVQKKADALAPLPKFEALALLKDQSFTSKIWKEFNLNDTSLNELNKLLQECKISLCKACENESLSFILKNDEIEFASSLSDAVSSKLTLKQSLTHKLDKVLIHKFFGLPIFLAFMWILFWLTFNLGQLPMDYIEEGFAWLGESVKSGISNELLASAISDGAISGVGAVLVFLPNIIILFFGIAMLEATGYMARVAFLLDGILHKFGLHGKSFIPLITGFGCSVPAFMATRTLKSRKDKLLTLFIINFMSCSARLPVYVLFIGIFFEGSTATNALFAIYLLGAFLGLMAAKILSNTAFRGNNEPFVMEMPKYRMPNWRVVYFMVSNKVKMYLKKAGTFILAASLLIWFASNFPQNQENEAKSVSQASNQSLVLEKSDENSSEKNTESLAEKSIENGFDEEEMAEVNLLENSYLGHIGRAIKPLFAPLGFDEKLSISLLSGLAAKEVMISTLGVLYGEGEEASLRAILKEQIPFSVAVAFVLFVMIYNPCFAATIVFSKESGSFKYTIYLFIFTCSVAYFMAFLGHNLLLFFA